MGKAAVSGLLFGQRGQLGQTPIQNAADGVAIHTLTHLGTAASSLGHSSLGVRDLRLHSFCSGLTALGRMDRKFGDKVFQADDMCSGGIYPHGNHTTPLEEQKASFSSSRTHLVRLSRKLASRLL